MPIENGGINPEVLKEMLETLDQGLEEFEPEDPVESDDDIDELLDELDEGDVLEGDDLLGLIELYSELIDGVLQEHGDCYELLNAEQATEIGLSPVDAELVNQAITAVNTAGQGLKPTGLPLATPRGEVVPYLASVVAYNSQIQTRAVFIGPLIRLLRLLWKLLKELFKARKHIRKIKQAQRLRDGGMITKNAARAIIAKRLAALATLIGVWAADIKAAKDLIVELRKKGKHKEADDMEKRVKKMEERLKEMEKEYEDLKKQEQGK